MSVRLELVVLGGPCSDLPHLWTGSCGSGPISFRQGLTVCMASATLLSEDRSPGAPSYATDSSPHSHGEVWKDEAEEEGETCVCVGGEGTLSLRFAVKSGE